MSKKIVLAIVLYLMLLITSVNVVYMKHQSRKIFAQLQNLDQERDALTIEFGQLQLEQSTWATHSRVEKIARDKLDMFVPAYELIKFIKIEKDI